MCSTEMKIAAPTPTGTNGGKSCRKGIRTRFNCRTKKLAQGLHDSACSMANLCGMQLSIAQRKQRRGMMTSVLVNFYPIKRELLA
jgi:hypothetical protein